MEISARIRDEPTAQENPAQVRRCAALLRDERRIDAALKTIFSKDAELLQRLIEPWLHRHFDEPVGCLMEHAAAHGEVGREMVVLMQRLDDEARNHRRISCDLKGISPLPLHEQRAFDANERCKRGILAMRAPWGNAG